MPVSGTLSTVVGLSLDPGYRFVAEQFDIVSGTCTCPGPGPDPQAVEALVESLKKLSLDPACTYLANQFGAKILTCCPTLPAFLPGEFSVGAENRTLDPGARKLGKLLVGLTNTCCGA